MRSVVLAAFVALSGCIGGLVVEAPEVEEQEPLEVFISAYRAMRNECPGGYGTVIAIFEDTNGSGALDEGDTRTSESTVCDGATGSPGPQGPPGPTGPRCKKGHGHGHCH